MMLVSKRYLPLIRVNLFAALFNRLTHQLKVVGRYRPGELDQLLAGDAVRAEAASARVNSKTRHVIRMASPGAVRSPYPRRVCSFALPLL